MPLANTKTVRLLDLSLRHKIPIWGSVLIVTSTVAVSSLLMYQAYTDLKRDLIISSENLGATLAKTLFPVLLHDDAWRAFELVRAPFHENQPRHPMEAETIFVVDPDLKILVSSSPRVMPLQASLDNLGEGYPLLAKALRESNPNVTNTFEFPNSDRLHITIPVAEEGKRVGTLVITHSKHIFLPRFFGIALSGVTTGALVLAILLPINWYWGRRTAEPLVELARGMGALVHGQSVSLSAAERYVHRDELGQLFAAYREAVDALNEKALLEKEMLHSERLAAVGRLAAGIAHEVNNPLGGMLMALDNLRQRGPLEPATAKTVDLVERGLQQVAETVGALLVEANVPSRPLTAHDFDDIHTLIEPQIGKITLDWQVSALPESMTLPAGLVRQILINLLLNAVQATESTKSGGQVRLEVSCTDRMMKLMVANTGEPLPENVRLHLFEPFIMGRTDGHGLGLWVTYQTVTQLGGQIISDWSDGEVRFIVNLPLEGLFA